MLRNAAQNGVGKVVIRRHANGSATVTIDDGEEIDLSPLLARLFGTLCQDSGNSDDELIGYTGRSEVGWHLGDETGKPSGRHAIAVAVNRLRDKLDACKYNRWLVQADAQRGYRLAVRRGVKPVIINDHM